MKKKIFIYGSCVSRDAFNFPEAQDKFELVGYYARSSLASIGSSAIDIDTKLLSNIKSNFQRKMVENDMTKQLLVDIINVDFDFLLIDLIDERFDLLEIAPNKFITYSNIYAEACQGVKSGRVIKKLSLEYEQLWINGLNRLYSILKEHNLINKVKINKVEWIFPFKEEQTFLFTDEYIQENNQFLSKCYHRLNQLFPSDSFLLFGKDLLKPDLSHKWGRSPFHYIPQLYQAMIQMLVYRIMQIKLKLYEGKLKVTIELEGGRGLEFAYYLLVNGVKREQIWYQSKSNIEFDVSTYSGALQVNVFVKTKYYDCKIIYSSASLITEHRGNYDLLLWQRAIFKYAGISDFCESMDFDCGIHSIRLTDKLNLDILVDGLECLKFTANQSRGLVVFGGAVNERKAKVAPFFSGINIAREAKMPLISISDPAFLLSNDLEVGWFLGDENCASLMNSIAQILQHLAKILSIKLIVIGGSAGGFASLSLASILPDTDYIIFNPQVKITNYYLRFVKSLVEICFPLAMAKLINSNTVNQSAKKIFEILFEKNHVKSDLSSYNLCSSNRLVYLQNSSDEMHVEKHTKLFIEKRRLQLLKSGSYQNENSCVFFGSWGEGHASIPSGYLVAVITLMKEQPSLKDVVDNLTAIDNLHNSTLILDK